MADNEYHRQPYSLNQGGTIDPAGHLKILKFFTRRERLGIEILMGNEIGIGFSAVGFLSSA